MRVVLGSAFFVLAAAGTLAFMGCSSSSDNSGAGGGDAAADGPAKTDGGKPQGDAGPGGSAVNISGSKAISVTAAIYDVAPTPNANAKCRISTADGSGYLDAVSDATGTCTFNVDPAKGPFDVTVGNTDTNPQIEAVTIAGVTDSVPGTVLQFNLSPTAQTKNFGVSGTISNLGQGHKLQIDAWDFSTVVTAVQGGGADAGADGGTTVTAFSSQYSYSPAVKTKIGLAVIEVDGNGNAVKGVLTPLQDRTGAAMTIPIDMNAANAQTPKPVNIKVNLPSTGLVTGTTIKQVDPSVVQDQHIGNCIIEKGTPDERGAAMFVGVGNVDMPANGVVNMHLQVFDNELKPDVAEALLTTLAPGSKNPTQTDALLDISPHDLTDGAQLTVPAVNHLTVGLLDADAGAANLGTIGVLADAAQGYDAVQIDVFDNKGTVLWRVFAPGNSLMGRPLPVLPGGVNLADIGAASGISVSVIKLATNKKPWEALRGDLLMSVGAYGVQVDPTGR